MDYGTLIELEASNFPGNILEEGDQVKSLTINRLTNLIKMKYGKEADVDYKLNDFVLSELQLDEKDSRELEIMVSSHWRFSAEEGGITIAPAK
ncbi:hypothetical protein [Salinicoccus sp. HZC-1]|uniref:hypothetical protein n=1 Tax=Salinicoccus sp. HZC-1 TaxID=3385497 RepID=UPI00398B3F4F